jgi:lipopolysaccharide/colanic/teichoic acid biosynthesis glycosyltransferase
MMADLQSMSVTLPVREAAGVHRGVRQDLEPRYRTPELSLLQQWYAKTKRGADILGVLLLAAPALAILVVAAVLVKLTSRGPFIYSQKRVGRHGRSFTIFKVRTMIDNCESLTGPRWAVPGDPRATAVGAFLRLTHLDELPQLFNVLRGDMSLIGPRPERPEFVSQLERALPGYRDRLSVRPGITGLAQVQLGPETSLDTARRKLAYDLCYIQRLGPWLDLRILGCTPLRVLGVSFRLLRLLFHFPTLGQTEATLRIGPARPTGRGTSKAA